MKLLETNDKLDELIYLFSNLSLKKTKKRRCFKRSKREKSKKKRSSTSSKNKSTIKKETFEECSSSSVEKYNINLSDHNDYENAGISKTILSNDYNNISREENAHSKQISERISVSMKRRKNKILTVERKPSVKKIFQTDSKIKKNRKKNKRRKKKKLKEIFENVETKKKEDENKGFE